MPDSKHSPLSFSLDLALSGKGAVPRADYDKALADAGRALDWLRGQRGSLELLGIPSRKDDLKAAAKLAAGIKGMKHGGSAGDRRLVIGRPGADRAGARRPRRVEFHDNPDPFSWDAAPAVSISRRRIIAISKSGGTAETLMQVLTAAEALTKAGVKSLKKHFTIITEPKKSVLADFADGIGAPKLAHPEGVGGRYIRCSRWWACCPRS